MSLVEKSAEGRLAGLVALRDFLAGELDGGGEKVQVAAVAKQLRETLAEIEVLAKGQKGSKVDDLKSRRKARRADASGVGVAAGGDV